MMPAPTSILGSGYSPKKTIPDRVAQIRLMYPNGVMVAALLDWNALMMAKWPTPPKRPTAP